MNKIYHEVKTPFKYGIVLKGEKDQLVDSPSIFKYDGKWYMIFIGMNSIGYETYLAESEDLLNWEKLGKILTFREDTWDALQVAGYISLQDHKWGGTNQLQTYVDKYWLSYLGGALPGYETDPLAIGIAWTFNPNLAHEWTRLDGPVISRDQPDVREFEKITQYKSNVIYDRDKATGYSFVMYYNGKDSSAHESIGMAVSDDMTTWSRYGEQPVIDNGSGITGDPQVVRIGDVWVMFYFGAFWKPKAFDTFACSYDLVNWTKWEGNHLIQPSESWDNKYAHKPWVVKHEGIVYHFYCAVGDHGRVIALATSKDLKSKK